MGVRSDEPKLGDVLAKRYKLIEEIGRGGFGVVYRANQLEMNRDVAVKLLHPTQGGDNEQTRERFRREAMMARNLNHPHTIRQYDFGETDQGLMYLVLEFLDGKNLVEIIRSTGALGEQRVKKMAQGVLKSLSEAHAQGIVHRDLKPGNIMLCQVYGETDYVKVLDFGIAKTVMGDTDLTAVGVALGSPRYMAPEILKGEAPTPAADVYSITITFAEAIMGKPLLPADGSVEVARLQLSDDPVPVPDELKDSFLYPWLSIGLKKRIEERYQTAEEMLRYMTATDAELAARGADFQRGTLAKTNVLEAIEPDTAPRKTPPPNDGSLLIQKPEGEDDDPNAPTMRLSADEAQAAISQYAAKLAAEQETDTSSGEGIAVDVPSIQIGDAELDRVTTQEKAVDEGSDDIKPTEVFSAINVEEDNPTFEREAKDQVEVGDADSDLPTEFIQADDLTSPSMQALERPNWDDEANQDTATPDTSDSNVQTVASPAVAVQTFTPATSDPQPAQTFGSQQQPSFGSQEQQSFGGVSERVQQQFGDSHPPFDDSKDRPTEMMQNPMYQPPKPFESQFAQQPADLSNGNQQVSAQANQNQFPLGQSTQFVDVDAPVVTDEQKEGRKKWLVLLGALAVAGFLILALAAGVIIAYSSGDKDDIPVDDTPVNVDEPEEPTVDEPTTDEPKEVVDEPNEEPKEEPKEEPPKEAALVTFDIRSEPNGAKIIIDGKTAGKTPSTVSRSSADLPVQISLKLKGYDDKLVMLRESKKSYKENLIPSLDIKKPRKPRKPKKDRVPLFD